MSDSLLVLSPHLRKKKEKKPPPLVSNDTGALATAEAAINALNPHDLELDDHGAVVSRAAPTALAAAAKALDALDPLELQVLLARSLASTKKPRGQHKQKLEKISFLNEEELVALFAAIDASDQPERQRIRDRAMFEIAYHRGLRASEVGLLRLGHVRISAKRIYVIRIKNGISAEFVMTDREMKALRVWLRVRGPLAGPLFLSRKKNAIGRRMLDVLMKQYGDAAGIPADKRHFHCLRHSSATSLRSMGVGIEDIQDHLGHVDIRNTMIYAKLTSPQRTKLGERLQREW